MCSDINIRLSKVRAIIIDRLSIILNYDLQDRIKRDFFQTKAVPVLQYESITWKLTKRVEKRLDGYYAKNFYQILEAIPHKRVALQPFTSHLTNHPREDEQVGEVRTNT